MRKGSLAFVVVVLSPFLVPAFGAAVRGQEAPMPPDQAGPAAAGGDPFPLACVSCHVVLPHMDTRFSTAMTRWQEAVEPKLLRHAQAAMTEGGALKGKHPANGAGFEDIPASCERCHALMSAAAPDFTRMIHLIHLDGGAENHYVAEFRGDCRPCHKLDLASGTWTVPSGPEQ